MILVGLPWANTVFSFILCTTNNFNIKTSNRIDNDENSTTVVRTETSENKKLTTAIFVIFVWKLTGIPLKRISRFDYLYFYY